MKRFITSLLLLAAIIVPGALTPQAMGQGNQQPYALEDAINTPVIKDRKARNSILSYQNSAKEELTSMSSSFRSVDGGILGITVATARDGEVIVISIPAELLFEPNSPDLSDEASRILRQYTSLMRVPDFYRMVLAMHHDNSGSRQYAESLTQKRGSIASTTGLPPTPLHASSLITPVATRCLPWTTTPFSTAASTAASRSTSCLAKP